MHKRARLAPYIELHSAVLILGFAGPIGKALVLDVPTLIAARAALAVPFLAIMVWHSRGHFRMESRNDSLLTLLAGVLMALHWMSFFHAMRVSTVAIGIVTTFAFPIITALLEPLLFRERYRWFTTFNAVLVLVGTLLVTGELSMASSNTRGALWGLLSAVLFASRNMLSRQLGARYGGTTLMLRQLIVVSVVLSPFLFLGNWHEMGPVDWTGYVVLGLLCTAVGHSMFTTALRTFGAASASISAGLQPIYASAIAVVWPGEVPDTATIIGGAVILAAVFHQSLRAAGAQPLRKLLRSR